MSLTKLFLAGNKFHLCGLLKYLYAAQIFPGYSSSLSWNSYKIFENLLMYRSTARIFPVFPDIPLPHPGIFTKSLKTADVQVHSLDFSRFSRIFLFPIPEFSQNSLKTCRCTGPQPGFFPFFPIILFLCLEFTPDLCRSISSPSPFYHSNACGYICP